MAENNNKEPVRCRMFTNNQGKRVLQILGKNTSNTNSTPKTDVRAMVLHSSCSDIAYSQDAPVNATEKENVLSGDDENIATEDVNSKLFEENCDRNNRWNRAATLSLIELYKAHVNDFKSTNMKNDRVWKKIAQAMMDNGYEFNKTQCENKFKYLKQRYLKKKDNMRRETGTSPIMFEFFDEFEDIFGQKANVLPTVIASSALIPSTSATKGRELIASTSPKSKELGEIKQPAVKRSRLENKINNLCDLLTNDKESREDARERRHKERQEMTSRALDIYEKMMEKLIDKL